MKTTGAANSLTAADRNSPVAMPLSKASQAMMPCHPGTLVTGRFSYPLFIGVEFSCISGPQKKHHHEQRCDTGQAARDGANVISHHVQPRIEGIVREAINGRA